MLTDKYGKVTKNPALTERNEAWKRFLCILREFGLSPSSRSRVSTNPTTTEQDADLAEFIA